MRTWTKESARTTSTRASNQEMTTTGVETGDMQRPIEAVADPRGEALCYPEICNNVGRKLPATAAPDRQPKRGPTSGHCGGSGALVIRGLRHQEAQIHLRGPRRLAAPPRRLPAQFPDLRPQQRH